jgi:hypothetical protein
MVNIELVSLLFALFICILAVIFCVWQIGKLLSMEPSINKNTQIDNTLNKQGSNNSNNKPNNTRFGESMNCIDNKIDTQKK